MDISSARVRRKRSAVLPQDIHPNFEVGVKNGNRRRSSVLLRGDHRPSVGWICRAVDRGGGCTRCHRRQINPSQELQRSRYGGSRRRHASMMRRHNHRCGWGCRMERSGGVGCRWLVNIHNPLVRADVYGRRPPAQRSSTTVAPLTFRGEPGSPACVLQCLDHPLYFKGRYG